MADKIVLGSDHAGLALRAEAVRVARAAGYDVEDLGPRLIQKPFTIETLTTRVRAALDEPIRR